MCCQSAAAALPESHLPGYCLLFTPLLKRSEVTATTSIFLSYPLAPFFSKHKEEQRANVGAVEGEGWGCVVGGRVGGDGSGGGLGGGVELEKNIERESSDQTALIRRGGRGGVLL